jgi:hypothetical protein
MKGGIIMSVKLKYPVKFEIQDTYALGVYLPEKLEYDSTTERYYQFLKIKCCDGGYQNFKIKLSKSNKENFFNLIVSFFSGEDLLQSDSFQRFTYWESIDGLPDSGKDFLLKTPAEVKAFLVNDEIVAIGDSSGSKWLILETDFMHSTISLYDLKTLKNHFIAKEKEKRQKKHEEVVVYIEKLITNVDNKEKVKNIKETLETLNDVDLIISEISSN